MDLKELLGEELYKQVSEKLGDKNKIAIVSDGSWFPKEKFDEMNEQKKLYKQQADDLNKQLEELKKTAKGNEEITKQLETLQNQLKDAEIKVKDVSLESAIKIGLINSKVKYVDLLTGKIDKTKLALDDKGNIKGLDEQIKSLQENYKDLFGEAIPPNPGVNPPGGGGTTKNPWSKEHFNLTEQGKILRENPTLAAQLIAAAK